MALAKPQMYIHHSTLLHWFTASSKAQQKETHAFNLSWLQVSLNLVESDRNYPCIKPIYACKQDRHCCDIETSSISSNLSLIPAFLTILTNISQEGWPKCIWSFIAMSLFTGEPATPPSTTWAGVTCPPITPTVHQPLYLYKYIYIYRSKGNAYIHKCHWRIYIYITKIQLQMYIC